MDFLCKHTCIFCDSLSHRKLDLCLACERDLPVLQNYCKRCAETLPEGQKICGSCLSDLSMQIETTALFNYSSPIDQLIINLKFRNNLIGARILGELLGNHLYDQYQNKIKPEVIIPVPLHSIRLRERGYNQALELSRPISKKLNIPIDKFSIKRVKNTAAQAVLSAKERQQNIKQAFGIDENFKYDYVAIIDDVVTTGNTVNELCKVLCSAGVSRIDIWCCAKRQFRNSASPT